MQARTVVVGATNFGTTGTEECADKTKVSFDRLKVYDRYRQGLINALAGANIQDQSTVPSTFITNDSGAQVEILPLIRDQLASARYPTLDETQSFQIVGDIPYLLIIMFNYK